MLCPITPWTWISVTLAIVAAHGAEAVNPQLGVFPIPAHIRHASVDADAKGSSWTDAHIDAQASLIVKEFSRPWKAVNCTCHDARLCQPVRVRHEREMFGFIYPDSKNFRHYRWTHLTTVAWLEDPELVCLAHNKTARVVMNAPNIAEGLRSAAHRARWVRDRVHHVLNHALDGINFDYETAMALGSAESYQYSALVALTARVLHALDPAYQVSVDVPWSPYGVDGRDYDWRGLYMAADIIFVMSYDTQSQIWGRCVASANTPLSLMRRGLDQWLQLGLPPDKTVLGLPWYGYDYPCTADSHGAPAARDVDVCMLTPSEFHGATCSDAAGVQRPYAQLMRWVREGRNTTPVLWDPVQSAVHYNYWSEEDQSVHQVWFDTPESLVPRYQVAKQLGLRGVGCWNLEWLYVGGDRDPDSSAQTWGARARHRHQGHGAGASVEDRPGGAMSSGGHLGGSQGSQGEDVVAPGDGGMSPEAEAAAQAMWAALDTGFFGP